MSASWRRSVVLSDFDASLLFWPGMIRLIRRPYQSSKLLTFAVFSVPLCALGQTTQTAPPPSPGLTLRSNAQLVVVDVVVTDKNGQPVHNLKSSDFSVLEGGAPQTVRNFEEHTALPPAEAAKLPPMPKMPPGQFTNYSPAPAGSSVNVLLFDSLNTPMEAQAFVGNQLLQYVKNEPPGTRVAIFGLTSRLIMLQGFTSDPAMLKEVIEKRLTAKSSVRMDDPLAGNSQQSVSDQLADLANGDPTMTEMIANVKQLEAVNASYELQLRVKYTLDAMNLLARYLEGIPGRKNLMWFSASFPISILPDGDLKDPFAVVADSQEEFADTIRLLARSQVAVYPIDARGLVADPSMNATTSGSKYANPNALGKAQGKFFEQNTDEHYTMQEMADETGGKAFVDTNALAESVAKAIDAGSNYYTLSYTPSDPKHDGSFRKIQVQLAQQGLTLSYRRGYYADDAKHDAAPLASGTAPSTTVKSLSVAMIHGGPVPTQIMMKARVLPASTEPEDTVAPGNQINPQYKDIKGPYRRYQMDIAVDPKDILFVHTPDDKYQANMEIRTFLYDQDSRLINTSGRDIHTGVSADAYKQMLEHGVQFHAQMSVPIKGDYYLRIGLYDEGSTKIGAMEIPISAVKNLSPLPAPGPPAVAPK